MPGGLSRWSRGKDTEWVAVRPELVCEVTYDKLEAGERFRHATGFLRWRTDKQPRQCGFDQIASAAECDVRGSFRSKYERTRAGTTRTVTPHPPSAASRHREPVEACADPDADAEGDDSRRHLGRTRGGKAGEDACDEAPRAMDQQQVRHPAEGGHGEALAARDQHVLAQLQRAAGDADHDERLEHPALRTAELVAEDHRDAEHELDLLLERVEGLARDGADREHRAQAGRNRGRAAQRTGGRNPSSRGTDQGLRKLIVGISRMSRAKALHLGPDRGFAPLHRVVEGFEDDA